MFWALLIPFAIQAVLIVFDEWVFHIKRGLPKWERIGHPLDTFSVVCCLVMIQVVPYSTQALLWYIGLGLFSCLLITKDEFVHKHHCPASEQWVHAILFVNHPILLSSMAMLWASSASTYPWLSHMHVHAQLIQSFLVGQTIFVSVFMLYQIIYWNFIWKVSEEK